MRDWTRRRVIGSLGAAVAAGCSGPASGGDPPAPAPGGDPAPAEPAPGSVLRSPLVKGGTGEPGTMFRPRTDLDPPKIEFVDTPTWFRHAGAVYCPAPRTAGASLLMFTEKGKHALSNRIKHFRELPELLEHGRRVGSDVLYLIDYYEGLPGAPASEYCWNKGEYVPREDLGGAEGLKAGIEAVHKAGGKVILYLEPFVIHQESALGKKVGQRWSIKTDKGYPDDPYPDAWKLCPASREVQDHLVRVAERLIGEYGADGLHLDSYGHQRGWKCVETAHGHAAGDGDVFDEGAKTLVERMFTAIRRKNREAVLMCEGSKFPALFRWVSGAQDWGPHEMSQRWTWAAAGKMGVFTSGWNLDDLHLVLAMGQRLALGADFWHDPPPAGTLAAWLAANLPDPIPDQKDHRFRRFFGEDFFRVAHQYRNAGLLLGRPMPNIDRLAPRRWDRADAFENNDGMRAILKALVEVAPRIDLALDGAATYPAAGGSGPTLPSPREHVQALVKARTALAPVLDGAVPTLVPEMRSGPEALACNFVGPNGVALTAANVGNAPVTLTLPKGGGAFVEHVTGARVQAGSDVELPPHSARLWGRAAKG